MGAVGASGVALMPTVTMLRLAPDAPFPSLPRALTRSAGGDQVPHQRQLCADDFQHRAGLESAQPCCSTLGSDAACGAAAQAHPRVPPPPDVGQHRRWAAFLSALTPYVSLFLFLYLSLSIALSLSLSLLVAFSTSFASSLLLSTYVHRRWAQYLGDLTPDPSKPLPAGTCALFKLDRNSYRNSVALGTLGTLALCTKQTASNERPGC
eukprot:2058193-Rhodomonas_salina.2